MKPHEMMGQMQSMEKTLEEELTSFKHKIPNHIYGTEFCFCCDYMSFDEAKEIVGNLYKFFYGDNKDK